MENNTLTPEEAIVAATFERIAQQTIGKSWLSVLLEWQASGESEKTDEMNLVLLELARELKMYVGDKAALNVKFPVH